jgi:hypothetical protein
MSSQSDKALINNYESQLRKEMPESCIPKFKTFQFCKFKAEEFIKTKYPEYKFGKNFHDNELGCQQEMYEFKECYDSFKRRYQDIKNFVAKKEKQKELYEPNEDVVYYNNLKQLAVNISYVGHLTGNDTNMVNIEPGRV